MSKSLFIAALTACFATVWGDPIGDVCNPDRIYNESYSYSLPRNILESYNRGGVNESASRLQRSGKEMKIPPKSRERSK